MEAEESFNSCEFSFIAALPEYSTLHKKTIGGDLSQIQNIAKGTTDPRVEFCLPK